MSILGTEETRRSEVRQITDPPVANLLFNDTRMAPLWLLVRLYVGYSWLESGWGKITGGTWASGDALRGFWERAVTVPDAPARPAIAFDWYRTFIQSLLNAGSYTWFADLIMIGEVLVGIALILGLFTGIAAAFGAFMNWNFMMAGTASINPLLFLLSVLLILAWKTAGWLGLDRFVLPAMGTPWRPGLIFRKETQAASAAPPRGV